MRRQIPGLNSQHQQFEDAFDGVFLVRLEKGIHRWNPTKPFVELQFVVLEPSTFQGRSFSGRLYCTEKALWKFHWLLKDFGYDTDLLHHDQFDERALLDLRGVVRTSPKVLNRRVYQSLDSFAPAAEWKTLYDKSVENPGVREKRMDSDGL